MTNADGFVYNSYYTNIAGDTEDKTINYALFGRPLSEGKLRINSINTIRLARISLVIPQLECDDDDEKNSF